MPSSLNLHPSSLPKTFYEKFERFADAPGAVAKMRELVLGLAVQGKLTERHSADQKDADWQDFTEKFDGRIYSYDPGPPPPFEIPDDWRWVCLDDIADYRAAKKVDPKDIPADAWLLDLEEIEKESGRILHFKTFREKASTSTKAHFAAGDVLYGKLRPYLNKVVVAPQPGYCTTEIVPIRSRGIVTPEYLALFLRSPAFVSYANSKSYGMKMPRLGTGDAESAEIPLPPLAEQKRIVAKVDALMALCDQLEAQQAEREAQAAAVQRAARHRFHQAPGPDTVDLLFHSAFNLQPSSLKSSSFIPQTSSLRQSILTLAVQGKLVPQDAGDEPASDLVTRLQQGLTAEQKKKQVKTLQPLSLEGFQIELPENWTWQHFCDVAIIASNLVKPDAYPDFTHLAPDNIEKGNGVLLPCRTVKEDKVRSSNHRFFPGQIVYSKIRPNLSKVVVVNFDGLCSADMYPIDPLIDAHFLQRYMLSEPFLIQAVKTDTRVAMPKINQTELNAIAVPTPPLAEQRRIVAKVDQLMSLVDQLEAQIEQSRSSAKKLLEALIAELAAA